MGTPTRHVSHRRGTRLACDLGARDRYGLYDSILVSSSGRGRDAKVCGQGWGQGQASRAVHSQFSISTPVSPPAVFFRRRSEWLNSAYHRATSSSCPLRQAIPRSQCEAQRTSGVGAHRSPAIKLNGVESIFQSGLHIGGKANRAAAVVFTATVVAIPPHREAQGVPKVCH